MAKAAFIAKPESFNSFMRFFQANQEKIESKAAEKIDIDYIFNCATVENNISESQSLNNFNSIKTAASFEDLLQKSQAEVFIDLTQTVESKDYILESLKNNKKIISFNRQVIVENFEKIKYLQENGSGKLYFSASFSPLPLRALIDNFFALDNLKEMNAILNATTNFILTEMEKNTISMKETIEQAKESSYIEENPDLDLGGLDSLHKVVLLSNLFYNTAVNPDLIKVKGIKGITSYDLIYAGELGYKIKLLTSIKKVENKLYLGVRPNLIRKDDFLASVNENSNAVEIISDYNSKTTFKSENTDSALNNLLSLDLIKAVQANNNKVDLNIKSEIEEVFDLYHNQKRSFYIRLQLEKDEEIIEKIKNIFSDKNLADLILHDNLTETPLLPVIIITKKITEKELEVILQEVEELRGVLTVNNIIPVK